LIGRSGDRLKIKFYATLTDATTVTSPITNVRSHGHPQAAEGAATLHSIGSIQ
jgi:hypothetical protein